MDEKQLRILLASFREEINENYITAMQALTFELRDLKQAFWDLKQKDKISYTLKEAAPLTGLAYETLYNLYKTGKLKGSQTSKKGSILVLRQDLIEFISSRNTEENFSIQPADLTRLLKKAKKYK